MKRSLKITLAVVLLLLSLSWGVAVTLDGSKDQKGQTAIEKMNRENAKENARLDYLESKK